MIAKEEVIKACIQLVNGRIGEVEAALKDADDALANDTKSSAGDKYETSREMVQQDINRYQKQLSLAQNDANVLQKIDLSQSLSMVVTGSLVQTDVGFYFVSISIGLVKVADKSIYVISPLSPLGQLLIGKSVGETISFNNKEQKIIGIS